MAGSARTRLYGHKGALLPAGASLRGWTCRGLFSPGKNNPRHNGRPRLGGAPTAWPDVARTGRGPLGGLPLGTTALEAPPGRRKCVTGVPLLWSLGVTMTVPA